MRRHRLVIAGILTACGLAVAAGNRQSDGAQLPAAPAAGLLAQAGNAPAAGKPSSAAPTRTRRLPPYYGQVGLSERQREAIYGLQAAYAERIEELERQLEALKGKRDQEIEAVLTPPQKTRLRQLVEAAARRRAGQSSSAPPKTAGDET